MVRLGVNVDHVGTVRNARGEYYPRVSRAAELAMDAGADQITIHLRKDRRHVIDEDLFPVKEACQKKGKLLNFEMGVDEEVMEIAAKLAPDWICIVPEKREELTTEGGLNVLDQNVFARTKNAMSYFKEKIPSTKISLFVESDLNTLERCLDLNAHACEIHTGEYAKDFLEGKNCDNHLECFAQAKKYLVNAGIGHHAGHGLTFESLSPLLKNDLFIEYNIGHWIISESIFLGLENVVSDLKKACLQGGDK